MAGSELARFDAAFTFNRAQIQSTRLEAECDEHGLCKVRGMYTRIAEKGFPAKELTERDGQVFGPELDELVRRILVVVRQGWYHHYVCDRKPDYYDIGSAWRLRIERVDGSVECWSGEDAAPHSINAVYDELTAFGMPRFKGAAETSATHHGVDNRDRDGFAHITCYERLARASVPQERDTHARLLDLARELCDDITLYLGLHAPEALADETQRVWAIDESADELRAQDVRQAPRIQMLALLGGLIRLPDRVRQAAALMEDGTFSRWCERLREIPKEEAQEQKRLHQEQRAARMQAIDTAIRGRMEGTGTFTSYDVAKECNVSAQQASVRIRAFVRKGELVPLEGDLPRQYRAAA